MEKLEGTTLNIVNQNIESLKKIFPEAFTEGKIDFDALKESLGEFVDGKKERYSFNWHGKSDAKRLAQLPSTGTLRPCREESVNFDTTENLYIEGDNLEVLKLFQKSYHGKVKMIYIDPPYNTGKDILYKNDFHDSIQYYKRFTGQSDSEGIDRTTNTESSGRYHSNWLNMMYPRLVLARNLLKEDGVLCLAIDQYELQNIIKVLDEIFGEENKLGIVTVVHKPEGRNQEKFFATSNEYAIFYAKNKGSFKFIPAILDPEVLKTYDKEDEKGLYRLNNYIRLGGGNENLRENKPNFYYPIFVSQDLQTISLDKINDYTAVYPNTATQERTWKTKKETFFERLKLGEIIAERDNKGTIVIYEKYRIENGQLIKTHWIDKKYNAIYNGTKVLEELMQTKTFDFPKSLYLLSDTLKITTEKNDIVLDFFSGSATSAHAVMLLNREDGGNRKYLMVQLPEPCKRDSEAFKAGYKNICEIGKERIRRAGKKILEENSDKDLSKLDIGFKVLKLDSSNIKEWDPLCHDNLESQLLFSVDNIKQERTAEDVLYEIFIKYGLELTVPWQIETCREKHFFVVGAGNLIVCLENSISRELITAILEYIERLEIVNPTIILKELGLGTDTNKTNILQQLKQAKIEDVKCV